MRRVVGFTDTNKDTYCPECAAREWPPLSRELKEGPRFSPVFSDSEYTFRGPFG